MRTTHSLGGAVAFGLCLAMLGVGAHAANAPEPARHAYDLTYRSFGKVETTSAFTKADGYDLRFEGCYAKHSEEAVCGFTLRATRPLTLANAQNLSHGAADDGSPIRTCCLFVQNDDRGYPITKDAAGAAGAATMNRALRPGDTLGVMLRVPNYRTPPLTSIAFAHGQGDRGVSFPTHVVELP